MIQRRHLIAAGATLAFPGLASAQAVDTARIMCGFAPGGNTDTVSRRLAERMQGAYAKTMVVENKPGAGGKLAVEELKRAAPDGSTLLLSPAGMITLYPHIYKSIGYGIDDVTPVGRACKLVFGLGVGPLVPAGVRNVSDFLAWAKANPTQANYGSPGAGSPPHFVAALLAKESGVDLRHVPYRGSAPGIQDLLGGQVAAFSSPIGDYLPHLKGGRLRLLATSAPARTRFTPEVATYAEQGFGELNLIEWFGVFMPPKTPAELVQRASAALRAAVAMPDLVEAFLALGLDPQSNSPAEIARAVREENAAWAPVIRKVGFTPEA